MPTWITWSLGAGMLAVGFLGSWLPGLPGLPLMAAGAVIHRWFLPGILSWWTVACFIAVALLGFVLDFLVTAYASRKAGATRPGTIGALLGGLIGIFFALPGLLLGPFLGAFMGELFISKRTAQEAARAGLGAALGFLAGTVGKGLLATGLLLLFLADAFLFR